MFGSGWGSTQYPRCLHIRGRGAACAPSISFRIEYIVHLIPQEVELGPMALEVSALFQAAVYCCNKRFFHAEQGTNGKTASLYPRLDNLQVLTNKEAS